MWGVKGANDLAPRCVKFLTSAVRSFSTKPTTNNEINPQVYNRNPRNLERLRIERKPIGYTLDKTFVEYWHKLEIKVNSDHVVAQVVHNNEKVVVEASTNEWCIYKQLYSKNDRMAYIVLAKIFAERCLETGLYSFACDINRDEKDTKLNLFLRLLEEEGLTLSEPPVFDVHDKYFKPEKRPWTVLEDPDASSS